MIEKPLPFSAFTLVDGCFDPLHPGHIKYFAAAKSLGLPVVCLVATDEYVKTKHRVLLTQDQRCEVLSSIRYLDMVIPSKGSTAEQIRMLKPKHYFKGSDWIGKIPDDQVAACNDSGTQLMFADTPLLSSSKILRDFWADKFYAETVTQESTPPKDQDQGLAGRKGTSW